MSRPTRSAITRVLFRHARPTRPLSIMLAALLVASLVDIAPANSYAGSRTATPVAVQSALHPHVFGAIELSFEPNRGQSARGTAFLARGHGYSVAINATGAALTLNPLESFRPLLDGTTNWPAVLDAFDETNYRGYLTFEYFHPYAHWPEALVYQTADSLDRMLGLKG